MVSETTKNNENSNKTQQKETKQARCPFLSHQRETEKDFSVNKEEEDDFVEATLTR